jgi:type III pantothenate kinase
VCSAEGAFALSGKSLAEGPYLLTIDFGTATTINIVKFPNYFIGGLIAPGVNTMFKSLSNQTSQLPELNAENYISVIGNDTNASIASGVINSTIGLIEKTISHISDLKDCKNIITYCTGGIAGKIKKYLPRNINYDEFLVLRGIKEIYYLNNL